MELLPKSVGDIVTQDFENEILVYQLSKNKAFCLNETSAIVFNHCNGKTTVKELKKKTNFSDELIFLALDQLNDEGLLEETELLEKLNVEFAGMTRRDLIRKIGYSSIVAIPLISSLIAPQAIHALSPAACLQACPVTQANPCLPSGGATIHTIGCAPTITECIALARTWTATNCCSGTYGGAAHSGTDCCRAACA